MAAHRPGTRGFKRTSSLLRESVRQASASRGFAATRLLTHWQEVAGPEIARTARPVDVTYGRQGAGATLTVLTTGAQAPMLEMQKETLRDRVNAVYGYNAISRIRVTQTAPTGFAEGQVSFEHRKTAPKIAPADPAIRTEAEGIVAPVTDMQLREALELLAKNVLTRSKR